MVDAYNEEPLFECMMQSSLPPRNSKNSTERRVFCVFVHVTWLKKKAVTNDVFGRTRSQSHQPFHFDSQPHLRASRASGQTPPSGIASYEAGSSGHNGNTIYIIEIDIFPSGSSYHYITGYHLLEELIPQT